MVHFISLVSIQRVVEELQLINLQNFHANIPKQLTLSGINSGSTHKKKRANFTKIFIHLQLKNIKGNSTPENGNHRKFISIYHIRQVVLILDLPYDVEVCFLPLATNLAAPV